MHCICWRKGTSGNGDPAAKRLRGQCFLAILGVHSAKELGFESGKIRGRTTSLCLFRQERTDGVKVLGRAQQPMSTDGFTSLITSSRDLWEGSHCRVTGELSPNQA